MEHFDKQNIERCIRRISDIKKEGEEIKIMLSEMKKRVRRDDDNLEHDYLINSIMSVSSIIINSNQASKELTEIIK